MIEIATASLLVGMLSFGVKSGALGGRRGSRRPAPFGDEECSGDNGGEPCFGSGAVLSLATMVGSHYTEIAEGIQPGAEA
jgi:hypothetical protein